MIISPITKERLNVQVVGAISRRLDELSSVTKLSRRMVHYEALRALALSSVPIILKFPFKAAIIDEYSDFKCHVLVKNGNDFTVDSQNICKFDKVDTDTFDGNLDQFV